MEAHALAVNNTALTGESRPVSCTAEPVRPETPRLDLTAPDGANWIAEGEAGNQIGPAADTAQTHVALDVLVHVIEAVRHERTARRKDRAQRRRPAPPSWVGGETPLERALRLHTALNHC